MLDSGLCDTLLTPFVGKSFGPPDGPRITAPWRPTDFHGGGGGGGGTLSGMMDQMLNTLLWLSICFAWNRFVVQSPISVIILHTCAYAVT